MIGTLPAIGSFVRVSWSIRWTFFARIELHYSPMLAKVDEGSGWSTAAALHDIMDVVIPRPLSELPSLVDEPVDLGSASEGVSLVGMTEKREQANHFCGGRVERTLTVVANGRLRRWYLSRVDYGPRNGLLRVAIAA